MSLLAVIASYRTGTYKVHRASEGEYEGGQYVRSAEIDEEISSVNVGASTLHLLAHSLADGDGPFFFTTDDALPAPVETLTPYWAIVAGSDDIQIAGTREDALSAAPIPLADAGSGTHRIASFLLLDLSVQPGMGADLEDLPEGQFAEATRTIWSTSEIKGRSPGWEPDNIEIDGELWRVKEVAFYGILSRHWKATVERLTTP